MKQRNLDSELLREGFGAYHKALFAVMEFRKEAGRIIQEAVQNRLPELAAALKMDEDTLGGEICPYTSPDRLTQKYDGSWTDLGIRIPKDYNSKWRMLFYLGLGEGEDPAIHALIFIKSPGSAIDRLARACKELQCDESDAWLWETVPADGSRDLAAVCDRVLNRWIALWRKVGGLHQFISKRS